MGWLTHTLVSRWRNFISCPQVPTHGHQRFEEVSSAGPGYQPMASPSATRGFEPWWIEASWSISLAIAPSTRKEYEQSVQQFEEFWQKHGYQSSWPLPVKQLMHYGIILKQKGLAMGLIRSTFFEVAFNSKALGHPENTEDFWVHKMMEGWVREVGIPWDSDRPLSLWSAKVSRECGTRFVHWSWKLICFTLLH